MMRERSLSKRIQALKDENKKYEQDNFRAVAPNAKTFGDSSPDFFKRKPQTCETSNTDNVPSTMGFEKV